MLSDARIRKLAESFVCVKVDPRDPGAGRAAFEHKSTRYVPEVIILSPGGETLGRLEGATVEKVLESMRAALEKVGRGG